MKSYCTVKVRSIIPAIDPLASSLLLLLLRGCMGQIGWPFGVLGGNSPTQGAPRTQQASPE